MAASQLFCATRTRLHLYIAVRATPCPGSPTPCRAARCPRRRCPATWRPLRAWTACRRPIWPATTCPWPTWAATRCRQWPPRAATGCRGTREATPTLIPHAPTRRARARHRFRSSPQSPPRLNLLRPFSPSPRRRPSRISALLANSLPADLRASPDLIDAPSLCECRAARVPVRTDVMRGDREPIYFARGVADDLVSMRHCAALFRICMCHLRLYVECRCRDGLFGRGRLATKL